MVRSGNTRTLAQRLRGGLERRARAVWKRWLRRGPEFPAEIALDWLILALHDSPADLRALCRETLLDYGCADVVATWDEEAASIQVPLLSDRLLPMVRKSLEPSASQKHLSSIELAQAAAHGYSRREIKQANAAFRLLEARQTVDGDFPSPVALFPKEPLRDRVLATKCYLDAARLRVSAAFDEHGQELPHSIDSREDRMVAVSEWMASLPPTAAVADVGCGSGRFLIHLANQFPMAKLTGIDPCPALLDRLPPSLHRHEGTLLRMNLKDAAFDGVYAVESLEHCLVAKRGVAELCRIVRPGGSLLIIDKHRSKQRLSEYEPWERWFHPQELIEWLGPFCNEIRAGSVSRTEGLFLLVTARRR